LGVCRFEESGYQCTPAIVDATTVQSLIGEFDASTTAGEDGDVRQRRGTEFARRNVLRLGFVRRLADSGAVRAIVNTTLGTNGQCVRGILFDKVPGANWTVPWHQDLSIAVAAKADVPGYGPWSMKAGVVHVQPPVEVLRSMVTVRIHLDDCPADNGPLKVIPGSHLEIHDAATIAALVERGPVHLCEVPAGGAVIVRPLIVHGSSPAERASHRRVIHLEYAAARLPPPLAWYESAELLDTGGTESIAR
jgi:hypothetical protein